MFENKTKVLIVTGILSPMHDWRNVNLMLRRSLEASGHFIVKICEEFRGMTAEALADYGVVLVNYDGIEEFSRDPAAQNTATPLGETAENTLCEFVRNGGGVMFFHSSTLPKECFSETYRALVGARETKDTYAPYSDTGYIIDVVPGHPITEGVEPHWQLCDDDFFNWIEVEPESQVLATIHDPVNQRDVPVIWCREYGAGRVFSCALGHQQDTLRRLDFCRLLIRGCDWAANGSVTAPMPTRDANDDWMRSWPWYYVSPIGREY